MLIIACCLFFIDVAMKEKELKKFVDAFGSKPVRIKTSVDALAVFVNKDTPVECMSIKQVDAVFSKKRKSLENERW